MIAGKYASSTKCSDHSTTNTKNQFLRRRKRIRIYFFRQLNAKIQKMKKHIFNSHH